MKKQVLFISARDSDEALKRELGHHPTYDGLLTKHRVGLFRADAHIAELRMRDMSADMTALSTLDGDFKIATTYVQAMELFRRMPRVDVAMCYRLQEEKLNLHVLMERYLVPMGIGKETRPVFVVAYQTMDSVLDHLELMETAFLDEDVDKKSHELDIVQSIKEKAWPGVVFAETKSFDFTIRLAKDILENHAHYSNSTGLVVSRLDELVSYRR